MERGTGLDVWWSIHGQALFDALQQVADGESPDLVYAELYANSEQEQA